MKNLVYILLGIVAAAFTGCSKFDANSEGIIIADKEDPDPTPTDTLLWDVVTGKSLPIENMIATPWIKYEKNGKKDSLRMESWLLDISTTDLVIYRENYQPSVKTGITPNADRSSEEEFKDKYGNMVTRHHYTQKYEFNNFTHQIDGAWNTGYVLVKGKPENFWPEDGLYYNISVSGNTVNDTVHTVRNDSIFAIENVKLTYTATLKVDPSKPYTWYTYERTATVMVISFVGIVEHEEEIPTADIYIPGLTKGGKANRFYTGRSENDGQWCDGLLISSNGDKYYMLVATFTVKDGKETQLSLKLDSIAKSAMATPAADDPYDAVMWDPDRNRAIPCHISVDGNGWALGARYADGSLVTKRHERNEAVISGIKNLSEEDNATPTPFIATKWNVLYEKDGKAIYNLEWHTNGKDGKPIHTIGTKVGDLSFKK